MENRITRLAERTHALKQSDIRAVTQRLNKAGGINLGQGICDLPTPADAQKGAQTAISDGHSIYTHYAGIQELREAIAEKAESYNKIPVSSVDEVMVSSGSTGAYVAALLALCDPGDEIVLFEPFYGYHRNVADLFDIKIRYVTTRPPNWDFSAEDLENLISERTKAIVINTPSNPSGKVWTRDELKSALRAAKGNDCYLITDEIYEYMTYDSHEHISMASLPGAYERTITLSGFSKTYNMTGWRLGYAVGPANLLEKMGLINDLLYICAPAPLQHGGLAALRMPERYLAELREVYSKRRQLLCDALDECGFDVPWPQGAYYVFAEFDSVALPEFRDDQKALDTLINQAGVAAVPGRSFFESPEDGSSLMRFCFAKELPELEQACNQLLDAFA